MGVALSGGQRQRVTLARALYSEAELLLLDDPLASVDAEVGRHLFEHAISRRWRAGATRILVTHSLQYLPQVDRVLCFSGGTVVESGTHHLILQMTRWQNIGVTLVIIIVKYCYYIYITQNMRK